MKSVMEYVRIYGMENTEEMDRIFRKRVHRPDYVAEYQRMYDANKVLFKGQPAVPFTFKDITGKEVSLSDLKGKYVYIDVWATWCGPCKMMHPILEEVKKRLGDKVIILKIDVDVPANRQPVYLYHIQSVPTLMLFKQGKVLWNNSGVVQASQLQDIIEKYI